MPVPARSSDALVIPEVFAALTAFIALPALHDLAAVATALYAMMGWAYVQVLRTGPGYSEERRQETNRFTWIRPSAPCITCRTYKPERTHHCRKCGLFLNFLCYA
eukprot:gene39660-66879_t